LNRIYQNYESIDYKNKNSLNNIYVFRKVNEPSNEYFFLDDEGK